MNVFAEQCLDQKTAHLRVVIVRPFLVMLGIKLDECLFVGVSGIELCHLFSFDNVVQPGSRE